MATLNSYFEDYATHHATPGNRVCHYIGIPLIVVTLLGLLAHLPVYHEIDGGILLWFVALLFYLSLDVKLGLGFSLVALASYFAGRALPLPVLWTFFILGWIFQFIGHYRYEKKSPSLFHNLLHIFIGPLWIFAKIVRRA